ncbi:MAG TPA: NAD(P)H-hydrate dehydratase [Acidimicrobiales bacterium]|nr:NAD(P)H-hydrate dehydratase [Acidimicrobiales bacterium]
MIPILTVSQMREADAAAVQARGIDALVAGAGTAVALEAQSILGSCYGARVAVLAGPGLNGADGRVAAGWLRFRGAKVDIVEFQTQPRELRGYELVIDAAFGLGASRPYRAPTVSSGTTVLAVDLPSGVNSDTGQVLGSPMRANVTLALGALKPAHVTGKSAALCGQLRFAGLGIVTHFDDGLMEDGDLEGLIQRETSDHKWKHAIEVFAGSTLMPGAADLVVRGALAAGASMIRLSSRGDIAQLIDLPAEVVRSEQTAVEKRSRCVVAGPGLGSDSVEWLRERLVSATMPVVLDADGLDRLLITSSPEDDTRWVLTPHEGEFVRLTGEAMPDNRLDAVRSLAKATGCVVLLKGPTTLIADRDGRVRVVRSGTPTLATAGSGDVLSGVIGATIARGHDPLEAAALGAHLHGRAGAMLPVYASASDIPMAIGDVIAAL